MVEFIDSLFNDADNHVVPLPLPNELPVKMVIELQNLIGAKYNVNIQQSGF